MPFTNDDFKRITFAGSSDTETARANFEASVQAEFGPYATVNGIGVVSYDYASAGGTVNHVEARTDYVEEYVYLSKYESGKEYAININQALTDKQGNPITDEDGNIVYDDGEMVYFTAGDTPEETAANINEYIKNNIVDYLSSGDYAKAFTEYANSAAALIEFEKTHGEPYDYDSAKDPVKPFSFGRLVGSLLAGLGAAFVPVSGMKSKLKTVRNQYGARNYAKENSLRVTTANDFFIGRHVSRTAIERSSSSGGSSTHVSSSGATHGGGGGKF